MTNVVMTLPKGLNAIWQKILTRSFDAECDYCGEVRTLTFEVWETRGHTPAGATP